MGDVNTTEEQVKEMASSPSERKTVTLDVKQLKMSNVERAEREIELPELNKLMGLGEGEIAVVKIRQLELDEYLSCQEKSQDKMRNLIEGVMAAAEKSGEVEEEVLASYKKLSPKAQYYVDLCLKGVVEPKMNRQHWVFMTKAFPLAVEKIASAIIILTKGGSNLKKNS